MKVLLDHCVPRRFGALLIGHEVNTTYKMGWADLSNGRLLKAAADGGFQAFLTVDQNVQFQQNLKSLALPVGVMVAENNRLETLSIFVPGVLNWLTQPLRNQLALIEANGRITIVR